jgi:demethylmenaquinone methyltransferase/2-methoxy-6-polyprenyl-1,4-benzoquinol methylase
MNKDANATTHFGYREVRIEEKTQLVRHVFDSVAENYDLMNDLMSLGVHRLWKRYFLGASGIKPGQVVLDLAGGTGDIASLLSQRVGRSGTVLLSDINPAMLRQGRRRLEDEGRIGNLKFALANAERLPFRNHQFDAVTMAFGLRNVTDKEGALGEIRRVLKPGGRALILEFSKVKLPLLSKIYDQYSFGVLPLLGRLVADDEESYRYLAESIRKHPKQEALADMMVSAGFRHVRYQNLNGGIVAIHEGTND